MVEHSLGQQENVPSENAKYRILIVDDEEINLKILRVYLEDKGYEVVAAANGEEAINIIRDEAVTVVICDIRMPKISGIDVLNYVTQHHPIIPVIMLTGFIDINTAVSVMRKGASNYLTKPIDAGELIIAVEKTIEHRKLLEEKLRLERENLAYQRDLEKNIEEKTQEIQRNMLDMVVALSNAVEERDPYLIGHSKRVAQYATALGRQLHQDKDVLRTLHYAAMLHDIGKIGIPDELLRKADSLSAEEDAVMRTHVARGVNILQPLSFFQNIIPAVRGHHERFDGSGYPDGLAGEAIPLTARVICLSNHFDVLTTGGSQRRALDAEQAIAEIEAERGGRFDPRLVDLFVLLLRKMMEKNPR